ncbi:hypothetical protein [Paractinoplanes toevensis]|uniref:Uncharacterized protein n=1 Tax=Paractinoplanes toevensis TaxID=571911 RepID=A0A919T454_9ACTN|nr:hypothetical protein [Actinoplanes toevensis]GIM88883.1 hypothetical protein Ato02nite_006760 [Actinoplanes toevensis]
MADQPIGPILDGLGVAIDLNEGDLVESALVIAKVVNADGQTTVGLFDSAGMDWLRPPGRRLTSE